MTYCAAWLTKQPLAKEAKCKKKKNWEKVEETLGNPDTMGKICLCFKNIWKRAALITKNKLETCPS